ncbi:3-hydroxyacyl-CoA dehydrogenase NAD-binding protein [Novosphingobium sp. Rr 2-17]|nr:3-hydroxyacyl-CoA dehydrogenase NAD-binding protein [Novosphingobium sp. Rr 2-17]
MAGSDISEFDKPIASPELPEVIAAITASRLSFVAAIHGSALGGGFELALGCDARVATMDAKLGLPEVTLGIIPGAGGTQHLPRLIPVAQAIEIAATGRRLSAAEALDLGIVDAVFADNLQDNAVTFAVNLAGRKRVLRDGDAIASSDDEIAAASAAALRRRNRPNVEQAIAMVKHALDMDVGSALKMEREIFQSLRTSSEAAALRHLFFAERQAPRVEGLKGVSRLPLHTVGVVGAGTMGSSIAIAIADAGLSVVTFDQSPAALQKANDRIAAHYSALVDKGHLDEASAGSRRARIRPASTLAEVAQTDLVLEAIIEDIDAKAELLAQLGELADEGTILATNTSYLDVDVLDGASGRSGQVVGLHFFNPAYRMKLLEIVRPAALSDPVLATALEFAKKLGKIPIVTRVGEGFVGNRIYAAYRRQCEFMLEEGALPQQIDEALEAFGMAMGPFAVGDMSGLDIAMHMRRRTAATRDTSARYVEIPDRLCEAGRLGRKTGAGYYRYPAGARKGLPDPIVDSLIAKASAEKGIERRAFSAEEIVRRAMAAIVGEADAILEEGIAQRPSDIDIALVNGFGFPAHLGGPLFWAARQDAVALAAASQEMIAMSGPGLKHGDVGRLLSRLQQHYPLG